MRTLVVFALDSASPSRTTSSCATSGVVSLFTVGVNVTDRRVISFLARPACLRTGRGGAEKLVAAQARLGGMTGQAEAGAR